MQGAAIRFWNPIRNCGDGIMSYIVRDVLEREPASATRREPHVLGVGSIFFMANLQSFIWGSGIISPDVKFEIDPAKVTAVRGTQSRSILRDRGYTIGDIPLGDPGILIHRIPACQKWMLQRNIHGPKYRAAIVPHWSSITHPFYQELMRRDDVVIVDMKDNTLTPVRQIIEAEVVISQSLHGLIFAEALGIPSTWLSFTEESKWIFKFLDWYTTVDKPPSSPSSPSEGLDELIRAAEVRPIRSDENALIDAFPASAVRRDVSSHFIDFRTARANSPHFVLGEKDLEVDYQETAVTESGLDERSLAFVRSLDRTVRRTYAHWAERPYSLIFSSGFEPRAEFAARLRLYMEEFRYASMLVLAPFDMAKQIAGNRLRSWNGLTVLQKQPAYGPAVMLRPTSDGRIDNKTDVVFVPPEELV